MRKIVIGIATFLLAALYALCSLLPQRQCIVCISRQSDSAPIDFRLIKDYCERRDPAWEVIILPKQLRNPTTYLLEMIRQVYYIATSRAVVLDSYCIVVSLLHDRIRVPVIQIWHSLGNMKRFGYTAFGTDEGHSEATARLMHMHEGYDAIATSSLSFADEFAAAFNAEPAKLFEAPLPRVDLLLDEQHRARQREAILAAHPKARIVFLTTFADDDYIVRALAIGARGYLIKQEARGLAEALHSVMEGQIVLGSDVTDRVSALIGQRPANGAGAAFDDSLSHPDNSQAAPAFAEGLTQRERDIAELIAEGLDNREIAQALYLSEGTVRNHISAILQKCGLRNRTQIAIAWWR